MAMKTLSLHKRTLQRVENRSWISFPWKTFVRFVSVSRIRIFFLRSILENAGNRHTHHSDGNLQIACNHILICLLIGIVGHVHGGVDIIQRVVPVPDNHAIRQFRRCVVGVFTFSVRGQRYRNIAWEALSQWRCCRVQGKRLLIADEEVKIIFTTSRFGNFNKNPNTRLNSHLH